MEAGAPVEDRLRAAIKYKNVRIREFFRDFDPLRKGSITSEYISVVKTLHFGHSKPIRALPDTLLQHYPN